MVCAVMFSIGNARCAPATLLYDRKCCSCVGALQLRVTILKYGKVLGVKKAYINTKYEVTRIILDLKKVISKPICRIMNWLV